MGKLFLLSVMGATLMSLSSCNGLFDDIYDTAQSTVSGDGYGFLSVGQDNSGTVYINTSDYKNWVYIDFHNRETKTVDMTAGGEEPSRWDIAVHRYDVKTNGGAVLETGFTGFDVLLSSGKMPEGDYISDIWTKDKIATDMSGMMEGRIVYAESYYNTALSRWLNVDKSTMPPNYTLSRKVYVVKLKDETSLAVRLSNYMDASGTKGYMTIEYIYPLGF